MGLELNLNTLDRCGFEQDSKDSESTICNPIDLSPIWTTIMICFWNQLSFALGWYNLSDSKPYKSGIQFGFEPNLNNYRNLDSYTSGVEVEDGWR